MLKPLAYASYYTQLAAAHALQAAQTVKTEAVEHKSELTCVAATTVIVGLGARAAGFNAGYQFAQQA